MILLLLPSMATYTIQISCLAVVHIILFSCWVSGALGRTSVYDENKGKHHLREQYGGFGEYENLKFHSIKKRSTLNRNETIYSSLVDICRQLDSQSPSVDSFQSITNFLEIPSGRQSPISTWPRVFPVKVQAERDGSDVWLDFDVMHTASMSVSRIRSFDEEHVFIPYPDTPWRSSSPRPIVSKVHLMVDASVCEETTRPNDPTADISFELPDKPLYVVTTSINLCMFDYILNNSIANGEGRGETMIPVMEDVSPPFFEFVSPDPGDEIVLERKQNATFELDIHLEDDDEMVFDVWAWDQRNGNNLYKSQRSLKLLNGVAGSFLAGNFNDLLSVDILEQTNMKSHWSERNTTVNSGDIEDVDDGQDSDGVRVRVRVTIRTYNGRTSGRLMMSYTRRQSNRHEQKVVKSLTATRVILLKRPHKADVLPSNHAEIDMPSTEFECGDDGNRNQQTQGKNCTVHCYARGTDITSIAITSSLSTHRPIKSVSQVYDGDMGAFAMINVGPASVDVDGQYRCTVMTHNEKKIRRNLRLLSSGFTRVFNNITLIEHRDFRVRVRCSASGHQPIAMSLYVVKDDGQSERVDNKESSSRFVSTFKVWNNMTVVLPASEVVHPSKYIRCEASGDRGRSNATLSLEKHVVMYNSPAPKINRDYDFSNITHYNNNTVRIYCEATGEEPLEFNIIKGLYSKSTQRIDNEPGAILAVTKTPMGKMLSLLVDKEYTHGYYETACVVRNSHGSDVYEFIPRQTYWQK